MHKYTQISLFETYNICDDLSNNNKHQFLQLLESVIDINDFIPTEFYNAFYHRLGRNRSFPLHGFIYALILQKILSIPTTALLVCLLNICSELRNFCGFSSVPDETRFSIFKRDFSDYLQVMFDKLVDFTEPICHDMNDELASCLIYDTTGIECFVSENNPKFVDSLIKRLKVLYKNKSNDDIYRIAYGSMPSHSSVDSSIRQMHINGHFCYARKFGILTNGLGIVRSIASLDDDFKSQHPEFSIDKVSDSPEEDKSIGDSTSLQPVLKDFFNMHNFSYDTFLGDSAFDAVSHYTFLLRECGFSKALIPLNPRNESFLPTPGYNEYGYPLCPNDNTLVMKRCGYTHEKGRSDRIKWKCPKVHMVKGEYICDCENPCSTAKQGRTTYTYNNDCRLSPGILRDSEEFTQLYKVRTIIERTINHFKDSMCVAGCKTRNLNTIKSDMLIAGITQLITVVIAHRLNQPELCRSLKPLIA